MWAIIFSGEDVYEYDYTDFYPEGQLDYGNQEIGMDFFLNFFDQLPAADNQL